MGKPIIITSIMDEQKEFTFNNFYELKGFLKGSIILLQNFKEDIELEEVLLHLGFNRDSGRGKICVVENNSYYATNEIASFDLLAKDVIEEYNNIKDKLLASIFPWPVPQKVLRSLTLKNLDDIYTMSELIVRKMDKLKESGLDIYFGEIDVEGYRQMNMNFETHREHLFFV